MGAGSAATVGPALHLPRADGVYFTPRLEQDRQCILVLIGADAQGRKELLAIRTVREAPRAG